MLRIIIPGGELYDEINNEFIYPQAHSLQLEHSLVSLSKWEAKWCKPFLTSGDKTPEETLDYIRAMTITQNVDPAIYFKIDQSIIDKITAYIEAPMTATTFINDNDKPNKEKITSEIIYYWMISFNIPFECQKWHLNRLLTLINVCNIKNAPAKKLSRGEILARNKRLNDLRKEQLKTSG